MDEDRNENNHLLLKSRNSRDNKPENIIIRESQKHIHSRDRIRSVYLAMKNNSLNQIVKLLNR